MEKKIVLTLSIEEAKDYQSHCAAFHRLIALQQQSVAEEEVSQDEKDMKQAVLREYSIKAEKLAAVFST